MFRSEDFCLGYFLEVKLESVEKVEGNKLLMKLFVNFWVVNFRIVDVE